MFLQIMYHDNVYCNFPKEKEGYNIEKFTLLPIKHLLYPYITNITYMLASKQAFFPMNPSRSFAVYFLF